MIVTVNTAVAIEAIAEDGVVIRTGERRHTITGDTIIVAGEPVASTELADELRELAVSVYAVGDCTGLGLIAGATSDAVGAVQRMNAALR